MSWFRKKPVAGAAPATAATGPPAATDKDSSPPSSASASASKGLGDASGSGTPAPAVAAAAVASRRTPAGTGAAGSAAALRSKSSKTPIPDAVKEDDGEAAGDDENDEGTPADEEAAGAGRAEADAAAAAGRSTVNGPALVSDFIPPAEAYDPASLQALADSAAAAAGIATTAMPKAAGAASSTNVAAAALGLNAPPYLRGNLLRLFVLKQQALVAVHGVIMGPGGLRDKFGFQGGPHGGAAAAVTGLAADLAGGGGPVPSLDMVVGELHEKTFENYNRWARMVGGTPVYSEAADPDAQALRSDRARMAAEMQAACRNCGLPPSAPGGAAVALEIGASMGKDAAGAELLAGGELASAGHASAASSFSGVSGATGASGASAASGASGASGSSGASGGSALGAAVLTIGGITIRAPAEAAPSPAGSASGSGASAAGGAGAGTGSAAGSPAPQRPRHGLVDSTGGTGGLEDGHGPGPGPDAASADGSASGAGAGAGMGQPAGEADGKKKKKKHKHKHNHKHGADGDATGEGGEAAEEEGGDEEPDIDPAAKAVLMQPEPTVASTQPGSDMHTRLVDLALYYCIRAEAANLRFMPELLCWLFHQMRMLKLAPSEEDIAANEADNPDPESSFFHRTTVAPLYAYIKNAAKRDQDADASVGWVICCCRKLGRKHARKNSVRPNYDDVNEYFWKAEALEYTWHSLDGEAGCTKLPSVRKTFREKASWVAVILSFWRFFALMVILFEALRGVSLQIVDAGGVNLAGIAHVDPVKALIHLTGCFMALAYLQVAHALLCAIHALPFGDPDFWKHTAHMVTPFNAVKALWAFGWAGAIGAIYYSKAILGSDLFGGGVWFAIIGARFVCLMASEGLFHACGCKRSNPVRRFFLGVERLYEFAPQHGSDTVLGYPHMVQPASRVWRYTVMWAGLLLIKCVLDLQFLTQQENLIRTVQGATLSYPWDSFELMGVKHPIVVVGSWVMTGSLFALDSYIVFVVGAAAIGWCTLRRDGVGRVRHSGAIKNAFLRGVGWGRRTPLAEQFVAKAIPLAGARGVDANAVFRRAWDQIIMSLRERDLISNSEQARLMYGDSVLGIANHLPLFLYAGRVKALIRRAPRIAQLAFTCGSDTEFIAAALPDEETEEAAAEIVRALPALLILVCRSHTAVGVTDPHIATTIQALFLPRPDQSLREMIGGILTAEGDRSRGGPVTTLRELAGLVARLCVEFEREGANTRLRGCQLITLTCDILRRMYRLRHPHVSEEQVEAAIFGTLGRRVTGTVEGGALSEPAPGMGFVGAPAYDPSFAGPMLERLASAAAHSASVSALGAADVAAAMGAVGTVALPGMGGGGGDEGDGDVEAADADAAGAAAGEDEGMPPTAGHRTRHGRRSSVIAGALNKALRGVLPPHMPHASSAASLADTRSVLGIIRLLQEPNESSGQLNGEGETHARDRYEALRESARRVFYLLTMDHTDGSTRVPEAERRLLTFVNSLYMDCMPVSHSVLEMPSFAVVTPHYAEAVIYEKRPFLRTANKQGISPMLYLKSLHAPEWANFCERLGVKNESEAWKAEKDAQGNAVSGEMEVRLWASHRGQTLARTVHGVMEYARAIRALAALQLEVEYSALEDARASAAATAGVPYTRLPQVRVEADAALAAAWFTAERFSYVVAAQLYFAHGEEDIRRRADIDWLLLSHPLLSVAFFENSASPFTAKRRLLSVLRRGNTDRFRVPLPGNPITDGIAEGKPTNQDNAAVYACARFIQTLDMNQDHSIEECLKLPNALRVMRVKDATGRPVAVAGMREHIFTHCLSSSAYFMSQQEYLFGVMWQRLMASPLRVRFHYGHPDIWDHVFIKTRGGTAKASAVVNVSEDIFAGYTAALRGGESEHIEFMTVGKGRDVGMLQIEVFESKISAGTAISMTARDSFRVFESMDLSRLLSYWHTCGGFYVSNVLTVLAYMATLYYMGAMALTGLDKAILASEKVYLLGDVNALQWFVQMGMLSVVPLFVLYGLEAGWLSALGRTLSMFGSLSPIFFMLEIQTKAYFFDAALAFGKSSYMATGRDFVIRHLSFDENYRATAVSHIYLGMEALTWLTLLTAFGTFQSPTAYLFFFVTGWLFTASLIFGAFWFNPFALEFKQVKADWRAWWRWLRADVTAGGPEVSWAVWYERDTGGQYSQANLATRIWRTIRVSRVLLLALLLVYRIPRSGVFLYLGLYIGLGLATIVALQFAHWLFAPCVSFGSGGSVAAGAGGHGHGAAAGSSSGAVEQDSRAGQLARSIVLRAMVAGFCGAAVFLAIAAGGFDIERVGLAFAAYWACLWWASRVANIASCWPLADGTREAHKVFDFMIGAFILSVQTFFAALCPGGSVLHTHMLFSRHYAETVEVVSGAKTLLDRHSKGAAAKFLKLKHMGEGDDPLTLQHKGGALTGDVLGEDEALGGAADTATSTHHAAVHRNPALRHLGPRPRNRWGLPKGRHTERDEYGLGGLEPENRIGVRHNMRLRKVADIGNTPKGEGPAAGAAGAADGNAGGAAGTGAGAGGAQGNSSSAADSGAGTGMSSSGGATLGTINIPGLAAAMADEAGNGALPPAAATAPGAGSASPAPAGTFGAAAALASLGIDGGAGSSIGGAGGPGKPRKSLREIMSEYSSKPKPAASDGKDKDGKDKKGKGKDEDSSDSDGKGKKKGKGKGSKPKVAGRWPPPKGGGSGSDSDGGPSASGLTGVAALRARLEKKAHKKEDSDA